MSYFDNIKPVTYKLNDKTFTVCNITVRTVMKKASTRNDFGHLEYTVNDGETPIVLADRLYENSSLFWVIMFYNDIYDIQSQWPLTIQSLYRFVDRKYNDDRNGIHHYKSIRTNLIVDSDWPVEDRVIVTNFDYEDEINEKKRKIKLPTPDIARYISLEHNKLVRK